MHSEKERIPLLIKRIQNGEKEAFEELYRLTSQKAYFIALKIVQNEHDAEDILQESYIKALEKIDEIDPEQSFTAWFNRVVANKSKDFLKGRKKLVFEGEEEQIFESVPEESTQFNPEESLEQDELCREVMAAIDELTAEKRACVMMMYFGEMSVNEIAESLDVPVSTVKNRLFTARKDLKNKFEKRGSTVLYGAAPAGLIIWALGKTSEAVGASFAASAASAQILSGVSASGIAVAASSAAAASAGAGAAGGAAGASTAAAAGTGIAAKAAALTVVQKVAVGVVAASVVGGSAAGVATVVKHNDPPPPETTAYTEEVTTAPSQSTEFAFAVIETTTQVTTSTTHTYTEEKTEPSATSAQAAKPKPTKPVKPTKTTTEKATTTVVTTTEKETTTQETTTEETTTKEETTTETTTVSETTTMQLPASITVEIVDMNDEVVDTLSLTVPVGTEMTWEYLITQIKNNGYEAMAGVYGDAVGATAEAGKSYNVTAEL